MNWHNRAPRPSRPPSQLLKAETAEREVRSMAYQLKVARFPVYRDLAGFDFSSSEVNEALVRQLHRCDFIEPVEQCCPGRWSGHRQNAHRHGTWRASHRTSQE